MHRKNNNKNKIKRENQIRIFFYPTGAIVDICRGPSSAVFPSTPLHSLPILISSVFHSSSSSLETSTPPCCLSPGVPGSVDYNEVVNHQAYYTYIVELCVKPYCTLVAKVTHTHCCRAIVLLLAWLGLQKWKLSWRNNQKCLIAVSFSSSSSSSSSAAAAAAIIRLHLRCAQWYRLFPSCPVCAIVVTKEAATTHIVVNNKPKRSSGWKRAHENWNVGIH